eukprot:97890_1
METIQINVTNILSNWLRLECKYTEEIFFYSIVLEYANDSMYKFVKEHNAIILENNNETIKNDTYLNQDNYGNTRANYYFTCGIHKYTIQYDNRDATYGFSSYIGVVNEKWIAKSTEYIGKDKNAWVYHLWSSQQFGNHDNWISYPDINLHPNIGEIYTLLIDMNNGKPIIELIKQRT